MISVPNWTGFTLAMASQLNYLSNTLVRKMTAKGFSL
jgi:hypothetical protein